MEQLSGIFCISVNYKKASQEIRGKLDFSQPLQQEFILRCLKFTNQCVILCTCARMEVYLAGDKDVTEDAIGILVELSKMGRLDIKKHMEIFQGKESVYHLFKVCAGMESMVIGEGEILRQVKQAYKQSQKLGAVSFAMNKLFQKALQCAKDIKTKTLLSKTSVSTALLAANEAAKIGENVNVLLLGASGHEGTLVLKNLICKKNIQIFAAVRKGKNLPLNLSASKVVSVDYEERYVYLSGCQCVISAVGAGEFTITKKGILQNNVLPYPRLFIDLAVSADIEPSAAVMDHGSLLGIDHFKQLAQQNNLLKLESLKDAERIVEEKADELFQEYAFKDMRSNGIAAFTAG